MTYIKKAYSSAQVYENMDPQVLILMLFKGALRFLKLAKIGVEECDPKKRGENISKVIAIVAELNNSLKMDKADEGVRFVKGLYIAILKELPKVSINNDIKIVNTTISYISKLKEIWENDVMSNNQDKLQSKVKMTVEKKAEIKKQSYSIGVRA